MKSFRHHDLFKVKLLVMKDQKMLLIVLLW